MSSVSVHSAAQNNQLSLLRSLVTEDPKLVNSVDDDGRTPLHWAASNGHIDIALYLIEKGAEVDKGSELMGIQSALDRKTSRANLWAQALTHYAASKSRVDINARDKANQLPLHRAATTGSTGFIALLLNPPEGNPKPRVNTGDRIGNTPLHLAMESAHAEAAALLIEAGADRSRVNLDEQTPEEVEGVGGAEQRRARAYVVDRCGKA
ncbi:putative proteolysis and peptidolysis-related protein [Artomyces pyxidatus]|uniref:Proteolysis and peptidolysis-related protein n=1 Tax=Artomyces pyxidatus TaxID=48021 RepID=A0ACB8T2L5_9AGAM|nr:putative proteolysis and peptidolysis-related protein [Artomyces pyxidatus]